MRAALRGADEPCALAELWDLTARLEQSGIAGFGWGASWVTADGAVATHRTTSAFRDDPGRETLGRETTKAAPVHLRRPSKCSTLSLADTQPFADPRPGASRSATTARCATIARAGRSSPPRDDSMAARIRRLGG